MYNYEKGTVITDSYYIEYIEYIGAKLEMICRFMDKPFHVIVNRPTLLT